MDMFESNSSGLESPVTHLKDITPDDGCDLDFASRAITVATEGFVKLTTIGGTTGRIFMVPGVPFPIRARRIWATGTTAEQIVVLA
ncbi:hypothetical protein D3P06_18540 [Paracoccus aestuarii]|uniref:Uncharacterized protein n=1 Tax=Paracoccus aestuarii TaxID=453842 RepID=A0A418ZPP1_9RHOB|nr:hypothetical protein D3P06_18540 [Paracoccus aestuarii]